MNKWSGRGTRRSGRGPVLGLVALEIRVRRAPLAGGGCERQGAPRRHVRREKRGKSSLAEGDRHASPGDWILVAPGDYKETDAEPEGPTAPGQGRGAGRPSPGIHIRGMNRNGVMHRRHQERHADVQQQPAPDQELGPADSEGHHSGRNGLEVFKAAGVSVENLSACNFQTGYHRPRQPDLVQLRRRLGQTDRRRLARRVPLRDRQFFEGKTRRFGSYGIFASNTGGPACYTQVYANNMADSDFYIGACRDCNTMLDHAHAETSALGYSGTNSGGHLTIQNSEFNNNKSGFVSNSQNNDDAPSPQDGVVPQVAKRARRARTTAGCSRKTRCTTTTTRTCRRRASREPAPVGSGVVLSGDRNNIVTGNSIYNNGAWGILLVAVPAVEEEPPPDLKEDNCLGGRSKSKAKPSATTTTSATKCRQHARPQRVLRQPEQRRPRRALQSGESRATAGTATRTPNSRWKNRRANRK